MIMGANMGSELMAMGSEGMNTGNMGKDGSVLVLCSGS